MAERFVMTQKNYEDLKKELDYLVKVKRPEIIERIAEARSHGDLSENAEYDAAREEQRSNEGKIAEIEFQIKNADVREEETDKSYVHLNSVVTVYDEDMEEEAVYTISSVTDVDVMHGKISIESPMGAALLKKRKGDKVTVSCPDGTSYTLKILKIN
ncbi:MAG: transcription elongation factor GreA [Clostridia bacterium]|nr:transcription elongation factor GreA [Clostridia bacterium]MDE7264875.1 transcription elongation factor GreA [Clostridia bacterium]